MSAKENTPATYDGPGIETVRAINTETGQRFVPPLSDYQLLSSEWSEVEYRVFGGTATGYTGGYWRGDPGAVRFESWPYDEICFMVKGRVVVRDATGRSREFGPGESFYIPQGFRGDWITLEPSEKVFVAVSR